MAFLVLGANSVSGYNVANSLRFNSASTDYLNRTNGTPTGTTKYTFSTWLKISKLSSRGQFFRVINPSSTATYTYLETDGSNFFGFTDYNGTSSLAFTTTAVFRDVSAWYHLVLAVDTTQATSTNRWKFYVNGVEVTSFASTSYGTQNQTIMATSSGKDANIGGDPVGAGATRKFDGYMSDVFFIDGQTLTPSSFGETDTDTGIWKPKAYTGTYGTNGFYLKFANSASLGTDSSGNANTFTVNNLTSVDQSTDTPTNNFCTWNSLNNTGGTLSQGNLAYSSATDWYTTLGTIGVSTGKWYWESKVTANTGNHILYGVANTSYFVNGTGTPVGTDSGSNSVGYSSFGNGVYIGNVNTAYGSTYTTGDIIGTALDMTNGTLIFYKNGSSLGTASTGLTGTYFPALSLGSTSNAISTNFGSPEYSANSYTDGAGYGNFSYAVPSGYYALCSANLAKYG